MEADHASGAAGGKEKFRWLVGALGAKGCFNGRMDCCTSPYSLPQCLSVTRIAFLTQGSAYPSTGQENGIAQHHGGEQPRKKIVQ